VSTDEAPRSDSTRIRQFFAGLLAIVGAVDALLRVHLPPMSLAALRLGRFGGRPRIEGRRRWLGTG
jgi:hypothetical protein